MTINRLANSGIRKKMLEHNEVRQSMKGLLGRDVTEAMALRKRITLPHVSIQDKPYVRTDPSVHRGIRSIRKHG